MAEAYIIDAVRTPRGIGKQGKGALAHLHPQHLAATVLKAIAERNGLDTADVDDIIWSTSSQPLCHPRESGDLRFLNVPTNRGSRFRGNDTGAVVLPPFTQPNNPFRRTSLVALLARHS